MFIAFKASDPIVSPNAKSFINQFGLPSQAQVRALGCDARGALKKLFWLSQSPKYEPNSSVNTASVIALTHPRTQCSIIFPTYRFTPTYENKYIANPMRHLKYTILNQSATASTLNVVSGAPINFLIGSSYNLLIKYA